MRNTRPFVLITGMHRSGTSFLSRSLNLYGVYLGRLDKIITHDWKAHKSNPRGHWENQDLLTLAEKTLAYNNGKWYDPPSKVRINKQISSGIKKYLKELEEHSLLASGFKDTRLLLCFDAWRKYLPKNFVIVAIFRHPLKVAESLKIRSNFDYQHSLELWEIYNKNLLRILEKNDGFLLNFDWPKKRLLSEIQYIANKLGLARKIDLSDWYTKKLIKSGKTYQKDFPLPNEIKLIYSKLKKRSENNRKVKINYPLEKREMHKIIEGLLSEIQEQGKYFKKIYGEKLLD